MKVETAAPEKRFEPIKITIETEEELAKVIGNMDPGGPLTRWLYGALKAKKEGISEDYNTDGVNPPGYRG